MPYGAYLARGYWFPVAFGDPQPQLGVTIELGIDVHCGELSFAQRKPCGQPNVLIYQCLTTEAGLGSQLGRSAFGHQSQFSGCIEGIIRPFYRFQFVTGSLSTVATYALGRV